MTAPARVISLASFKREKEGRDDVVTEIIFQIRRDGSIIANHQPRIARLHTLAVVSWAQELAANVLNQYIDSE